jgi:hypothetical protein
VHDSTFDDVIGKLDKVQIVGDLAHRPSR